MERIKHEKAQVEIEKEEMRIKIVENDVYEREKQYKLEAKSEKHLKGLDAQISAGIQMKRLIKETEKMTLLQEAEMQKVYNERLEAERNRILKGGVIH